MSAYRVDLGELQSFIEQLSRFDTLALEGTDTAASHVNRLHATWQGDAADSHLSAYDRWRQGAAQMREGLAAMQRAAATAHGNYSSAVTANQTMWTLG